MKVYKCFCGSFYQSKGINKSCGCLSSFKLAELRAIKMIGKQYGRGTVIAYDYVNYRNQKIISVWCLCKCGKIYIGSASQIRREAIYSCGCKWRENCSKLGCVYNKYKSRYKWFFIKKNRKVRCKSGIEVLFANFLLSENIDFLYEPKRFLLKDGRYTPDFYIPSIDLYIEVKPSAILEKKQAINIEEFSKSHNLVVFYLSEIFNLIPNVKFASYTSFFRNANKLGVSKEEYFASSMYLKEETLSNYRGMNYDY